MVQLKQLFHGWHLGQLWECGGDGEGGAVVHYRYVDCGRECFDLFGKYKFGRIATLDTAPYVMPTFPFILPYYRRLDCALKAPTARILKHSNIYR